MNTEDIKFDDRGLVPVVIQDAENGQVLMVAYANKEAIEETLRTRRVHFWSRSRNKLWQKGEESGNFQEVREVFVDCDKDAILITVNQRGVTCHTGQRSCFFKTIEGQERNAPTFGAPRLGKTLEEVYNVVEDRKRNPKEHSYVSSLFQNGIDRILKKLGEETTEAIVAAKNGSKDEIVYETADLWFHSLLVLAYFGITPEDIYKELARRFGKPKHKYRPSP